MQADLSSGVQRRIVIATPEPAIARILSHKLAREGHDVQSVSTPQALHAAIDTCRIDVALIDLQLAGDETDVIASRLTAGWLAIIDGRQPHLATPAMRAGAAGLVRTPFKPTEVAAQVATLLTLAPAS